MLRSLCKHLHTYVKNYRMVSNIASKVNATSTEKLTLDLEVNRILWIDMEMTGLNIEIDKIMEVACLVTDADLNILAEGPSVIINHSESILNGMNDWCTKQHGKSGLTQACLKSQVTIEEAENRILDFVKKYSTERQSPLAGNSVYMDRLFLRKFMPKVDSYLHYRIIDVSTVKEICRRWNPKLYKKAPKKTFSHRALDDIKESINELKFYKEHFFHTT